MNFLVRSSRLASRRVAIGRAMMSTMTHSHSSSSMATPPPGFDTKKAQIARPQVPERHSTFIVDRAQKAAKMPPGFKAEVAELDTFKLPDRATGSLGDHLLGKALIDAWRKDGIIQIAMTDEEKRLWDDARAASKKFFRRPHAVKAACVDSQSYAGYIASGEEVTDGIADYSEIFTITKDLDTTDPRVQAGWPCHGPCPWPDSSMKETMTRYNDALGRQGEKLLGLIEMGLGLTPGSLTRYTRDGWHHTRVLRFPPRNMTNGKGKDGRGIGSHTDYGLLVIAAQDDVGGLFVRRPNDEEKFANWVESAAGLREDDDGWMFVPPVEGVHTVILGDMMQYLTHGFLEATPHKVGLNTRERYSFAYFHEPSFQAVLKPLEGGCGGKLDESTKDDEGIHYGTHFTNMFLRNYPDRITTKRLVAEGRYSLLSKEELRTIDALPAL